jgi:hypothetical protein
MQKNTFLTPSICGVYLVPLSEIASVLPDSDGFHYHVTLKAGTDWQQIYFTPGSAELTEKPKETDAGLLYEQTLRMTFPGDDDTNLAALDQIVDRPGLVKIQLSSGQFHLMGEMENGARLSRSFQLAGKNSGSQLEFTCLGIRPIGWILA